MRDPVQIALIALGIAILVFWATTQRPSPRESPPAGAPPAEAWQPAAERETAPRTAEAPSVPAEVPPLTAPAPSERVTIPRQKIEIHNDAVRLQVSNVGGRVEGIEVLGYADRIGEASQPVQLVTEQQQGTLIATVGDGALAGLESVTHELVSAEARQVIYRSARDGVVIRRTLSLDEHGYGGQLRVSLANRGERSVQPRFELQFYGQERASDAPDRFLNYQLVAMDAEGDLQRRRVAGIESPGFLDGIFGGGSGPKDTLLPAGVEWAGVESQYFLLAALPENPRESSATQRPVGRDTGLATLQYPAFEVPPGRQVERVYRLYFGPKTGEDARAVDERLEPAVRVGWAWVRPIVDGFARLLVWSHDHVISNYGVSIILLTILLRVGTYPLTHKSMKSMKRLGEIAPLMKELQAKYKNDKEKLSAAMMSLYREKGINPVSAMGGGCLPMLIQMPFMIALYFALQGSIELRHAPFALWIQDLSAPEDFLSLFGFPIRPLPLLMGASMLLQQRLSPQTGDPQQRQMMMWMSVVFTFMFYQFPSGLLLYWFVSNLLGIAQQFLVNRPRPAASA